MSGSVIATLLIGAAIGIVAQWFGMLLQDSMSKRQETREEAREAKRAENAVQIQAAQRISGLFEDLFKDLPARFGRLEGEEGSVLIDRVHATAAALRRETLFLPNDVMERVLLILDVATEAYALAPGPDSSGYHYHSKDQILDHCELEVRRELSAFIRGKPLAGLSPILAEYAFALELDYDEGRNEFAEEIHESRQSRVDWIERYPGARELTPPPED
jgi:hypothetical protein